MKLSQAKALLIKEISRKEGITLAQTSEIDLILIQKVKHGILTPDQAASMWINDYSLVCNKSFNI